ncbi:MAG: ABC transporter related protein [Parcubacteria group bacterium GW2011_GWB1_50_9]|nr:MAG: ABC transporter related protein [Parcubacteria group bacterium GW2011_GWB1_50_9]
MKETFRLLIRTYRPYLPQLVLMGCVGLAGSIAASVGVGMVIPLLSFVIGGEGGGENMITRFVAAVFQYLPFPYDIRSLAVFIIIFFVLKAGFLFLFSYVRLSVMYHYRTREMGDILRKVLRARWPVLLFQKAGYIQTALTQDVDRSSQLLGSLAYLPLAFVSVAVFLSVAFTISYPITIITVMVGGILLAILGPLLRKTKVLREAFARESKNLFQYLIEHLGGLKTIKALAVEDEVLLRGEEQFNQWRSLELKGNIIRSLNKQAIEPASVVLISSIFLFSYYTTEFHFESFVAIIYLVQQIFLQIELIQGALHDINESLPHVVFVEQFKRMLSGSQEEFRQGLPFRFEHEVMFRGVTFSHTGKTELFSHLSFSVKKGEMVGIVGVSGAGKTTIADLLMRFFSPQGGGILLDGRPAEEFDLHEWRKRISYVSQDIFLLNDTIEHNVRFYRGNVSDEDIRFALQRAYIHDFVMSLPQGIRTVVGERGTMLSGGQRQRIVLARALAELPSVLILDEATSALDIESERHIQHAIENLRGKVTIIIIAHRLSTVMGADRIFVLDEGSVKEEGRPRDLLADPKSVFSRMHSMHK